MRPHLYGEQTGPSQAAGGSANGLTAILGGCNYFLTQTFFLGGTSPQHTCSVGRGRSKCPSYHPPTPYTLSPLPKGGEGRGEGGSDTHVPCPFGALLVTLYHFKSKAFLMCGGGGHARLRGERQLHLTLPSYIQKPFARNWYNTISKYTASSS